MKKYALLLIMLIFSCLACYSQNILDPQPLNIDYHNMLVDSSAFPLLWNWGSIGYPLDEAMEVRYNHNSEADVNNSFDCQNERRISAVSGHIVDGKTKKCLINSQTIVYEPTIAIDSTLNFQIRPGDTLGSVFGFKYRNFTVGDTVSNGENFHRFILSKANLISVKI
jgi:hypothetical protein